MCETHTSLTFWGQLFILFYFKYMPFKKKYSSRILKKVLFSKKYYAAIIIYIKLLLEQRISILEWFLKDHVTLKTGVMMHCKTGINYIRTFKLFLIVFFKQLNSNIVFKHNRMLSVPKNEIPSTVIRHIWALFQDLAFACECTWN